MGYSTHGQSTSTSNIISGAQELTPHLVEASYFEPFGERIPGAPVQNQDGPRYTNHEFDSESALNYMKGRFQLATYAKFNRPDPMRDWNWLRPHTLNLYQYVGNDPVNAWDPTGLAQRMYIDKDALKKGNIVNVIEVTGKIINNSGRVLSDEQMSKAAERSMAAFSQIEAPSINGEDFRFELKLTVAKTENEISQTDDKVRLVESSTIEGVLGRADQPSATARIDVNLVDNLPAKSGENAKRRLTTADEATLGSVVSHEIGHNLALGHLNRDHNLMTDQPTNNDPNLKTPYKQGMKLTEKQIKIIVGRLGKMAAEGK